MRKTLVLLVIVLLAQSAPHAQTATACTIGVASGVVTEDGRPLLWKARQSADPLGNQVVTENV